MSKLSTLVARLCKYLNMGSCISQVLSNWSFVNIVKHYVYRNVFKLLKRVQWKIASHVPWPDTLTFEQAIKIKDLRVTQGSSFRVIATRTSVLTPFPYVLYGHQPSGTRLCEMARKRLDDPVDMWF